MLNLSVLDQKLCAIEGFPRVYLYFFLKQKVTQKQAKVLSLKVEYLENGMY